MGLLHSIALELLKRAFIRYFLISYSFIDGGWVAGRAGLLAKATVTR
jgi:hypothetical protein